MDLLLLPILAPDQQDRAHRVLLLNVRHAVRLGCGELVGPFEFAVRILTRFTTVSLATDHARAVLFKCVSLLMSGECVSLHAFVVQFVPSMAGVGSLLIVLQVTSFLDSCLI